MGLHEIKKARNALHYEDVRQTFDAYVLPMAELHLRPEEEKAYVRNAALAASRIVWDSYDTVRESFQKQAEYLLQPYEERMPIQGMETMKCKMYVRFMEGRIRFFEHLEKCEYSEFPTIEVGDMDFHNTEMAAVFAHLPPQPEITGWLQELDISWDYDRLHMVTWFSGQLSLGSGKYSRSRPNHSAKVTYERLLNPFSLLWIAAAMGVDRDLVVRTRNEIDEYVSWRVKCDVIRRAIPWKRIYELALPLVEEERRHNGGKGKTDV